MVFFILLWWQFLPFARIKNPKMGEHKFTKKFLFKNKNFCCLTAYFFPFKHETLLKHIGFFCHNRKIVTVRMQNILFCYRTSFSVLEHHFPALERPFLLCPVLSHVPSRILSVPARLSLGKIFSLSRCPFVPGQWRNFCHFVPKSF